jgi:hypothetical protein
MKECNKNKLTSAKVICEIRRTSDNISMPNQQPQSDYLHFATMAAMQTPPGIY